MRNLTFALVTLTVLAGTIAGCGDSSSSAPHAIAGSGGGANAGAPGAGSGGTTVSAGAGGATAGAPADTAGTGGAIAGAGGDVSGAGTGGATAGAPAGGAAPTPCDNVPNKPLPFSIAADFPIEHVLTEGSAASWQNIANPDCDATTFPAFPSGGAGGGGGSGGASAGAGGASAGTGGTAGTAGSGGTGGTAGSAGTGGASASAGTGGTAGTSGTGGTGGTAGTAGASGGGGVSGAAGTSGGAGMSGSAGSAGTGGMSGAGGGSAQAPACYEFAYNPDPCINSGTGSVCWAGMIFQPTDMMGPAIKGVCIQPGANAIEFSARSSRDAARVKFGSIRPGVDSTEHWLNLTTTWTKYTITIPDTDAYTYDASSTDPAGGVWNGFSVVVEPADHTGGSYILVKDVVWKKQ